MVTLSLYALDIILKHIISVNGKWWSHKKRNWKFRFLKIKFSVNGIFYTFHIFMLKRILFYAPFHLLHVC